MGGGGTVNNYYGSPQQASSGNGLQNAAIAGVAGLALYGALRPVGGDNEKTIIIHEKADPAAPVPAGVATNPAAPVANPAAPLDPAAAVNPAMPVYPAAMPGNPAGMPGNPAVPVVAGAPVDPNAPSTQTPLAPFPVADNFGNIGVKAPYDPSLLTQAPPVASTDVTTPSVVSTVAELKNPSDTVTKSDTGVSPSEMVTNSDAPAVTSGATVDTVTAVPNNTTVNAEPSATENVNKSQDSSAGTVVSTDNSPAANATSDVSKSETAAGTASSTETSAPIVLPTNGTDSITNSTDIATVPLAAFPVDSTNKTDSDVQSVSPSKPSDFVRPFLPSVPLAPYPVHTPIACNPAHNINDASTNCSILIVAPMDATTSVPLATAAAAINLNAAPPVGVASNSNTNFAAQSAHRENGATANMIACNLIVLPAIMLLRTIW